MISFQAEAIPLLLIVFKQPHLDWMDHLLIYSPSPKLDSRDIQCNNANNDWNYPPYSLVNKIDMVSSITSQ